MMIKKKCKYKGFKAGGVLTIETALVLPVFLFITLNLFSLLDMVHVYTEMDMALYKVGREISVYSYGADKVVDFYGETEDKKSEEEGEKLLPENKDAEASSESGDISKVKEIAAEGYAYACLCETARRGEIDLSLIKGGMAGVSLLRSDFDEKKGLVNLTVTYRVKPWFSFYDVGTLSFYHHNVMKTWTGYTPDETNANDEDRIVYITEDSDVYHIFRDCSHLKLDIGSCGFEELETKRNSNGGKYYPCEKCVGKNDLSNQTVFIAADGDKYHSVISCSGLKRTVREIPLSQVGSRRECIRCASR